MHELYHILEHLPKMQRIIGVNMMDEQFEEEADRFGVSLAKGDGL